MAFRPGMSRDSSRHSIPVYHHLSPAQAGNIACQMRSPIHRLEQGVADTQLRKHDPREYQSRVRGLEPPLGGVAPILLRYFGGDDGGDEQPEARMRPEALDCWLYPCRRRLGPPQGACPYPLPATTRLPSGPEVAMEMGLRKQSENLVRSPSRELEGLFEG